MPDFSAFSAEDFERNGIAFIPSLLDGARTFSLATAFHNCKGGGGKRHLLDHPVVIDVLESASIQKLIARVLSARAFAFKASLFDKHDQANWLVSWHRDVFIPVSRRWEIAGWSTWTVKDGVDYVRPPREVLDRIVALRINIDPCDAEDGPLRVLPGSHRIEGAASADNAMECLGDSGDAWLMSPLIWHASSKLVRSTRRRVLHIEFADFALPAGLHWHRQIEMGSIDVNH